MHFFKNTKINVTNNKISIDFEIDLPENENDYSPPKVLYNSDEGMC